MGCEYTFRVRGRLGPTLVAALHPLEVVPPEVETTLRGEVTDQAALHGLMARLEQLGLEIVDLRRLPRAVPAGGGHASAATRKPTFPAELSGAFPLRAAHR